MYETISWCSSEDLSCLEMELLHLHKFPRNFFLNYHFPLVIYSGAPAPSDLCFDVCSLWLCFSRIMSYVWEQELAMGSPARVVLPLWVETEIFKLGRYTESIHETLDTTSLFHVVQKPFGETVTSSPLKVFILFLKKVYQHPELKMIHSWTWASAVACCCAAAELMHSNSSCTTYYFWKSQRAEGWDKKSQLINSQVKKYLTRF